MPTVSSGGQLISGESPLVFATTIAHELGHAVLTAGAAVPGMDANNPNEAIAQGELHEGVALTAEYIVGVQLGLTGSLRIHSDPEGKLTPQLDQIAGNLGIDISRLQFGSDQANAFSQAGSDAVTTAGAWYGDSNPSGSRELTYDQKFADWWILSHCTTINPGTIDWSKVAPIQNGVGTSVPGALTGTIDYEQRPDGSCVISAKDLQLLNSATKPGGAGRVLQIDANISALGQPISLTWSVDESVNGKLADREIYNASGQASLTTVSYDASGNPIEHNLGNFLSAGSVLNSADESPPLDELANCVVRFTREAPPAA